MDSFLRPLGIVYIPRFTRWIHAQHSLKIKMFFLKFTSILSMQNLLKNNFKYIFDNNRSYTGHIPVIFLMARGRYKHKSWVCIDI